MLWLRYPSAKFGSLPMWNGSITSPVSDRLCRISPSNLQLASSAFFEVTALMDLVAARSFPTFGLGTSADSEGSLVWWGARIYKWYLYFRVRCTQSTTSIPGARHWQLSLTRLYALSTHSAPAWCKASSKFFWFHIIDPTFKFHDTLAVLCRGCH